MAFYVYSLRCVDGSYYTGHTDDLDARLAAHGSGGFLGYTLSRRPLKLVFAAEFASRDEAFRRERQIKGWSRRKKEALITQDWVRLSAFSHGKPLRQEPPAARASTSSA